MISVPPPSRNAWNASTPSWPKPPLMSGDSPYIPRNLYLSLFRYGCGRAAGCCMHRLARDALRRHDDHVVVGAQVALRHTLLEDQVERNAELIEREAIPAEFLRAVPLRVERDARRIGVVHGHVRQRRHRRAGEAEARRLLHDGLHVRRSVDDERARRELDAVLREALLDDLHRARSAACSGTRSCCSSRSARSPARRRACTVTLPCSASDFTSVVGASRIALSAISFTSTLNA